MIPVRTVDDLMEAAHGYQRSMLLFVALRYRIFDRLAKGPADAPALARACGADGRRLGILLDALAATGLLAKEGERYRNAEVAQRFLADGPESKASILLHHLDCWGDWSRLADRIARDGKAPKIPGWTENFIRGMEDNARERAVRVARAVPLRSGWRVLDLGGGPGTYAVAWKRSYPGAELTVFDTRETLAVTRKILREKGVLREIRLVEGDFLADPVGGPWDFVWISQILHAYGERDCLRILRKVRRSLAPGGTAAVQEFLLEEGKTSPPGPAFFSVHMVAATDGGRSYTGREIARMMREAGLRDPSQEGPDDRGVGIVTAQK